MLTPDDIIKTEGFVSAMFGLSPGYDHPDLSVVDHSQELKSVCLIECTYQIWSRFGYTIQITMIRAQDEQAASRVASKLFYALQPSDMDQLGEDELSNVNAPIENTHIAFSFRRGWELTTSRGPIAIHVLLYGSWGDDPGFGEYPEIEFTNLQINKLKRENVIP